MPENELPADFARDLAVEIGHLDEPTSAPPALSVAPAELPGVETELLVGFLEVMAAAPPGTLALTKIAGTDSGGPLVRFQGAYSPFDAETVRLPPFTVRPAQVTPAALAAVLFDYATRIEQATDPEAARLASFTRGERPMSRETDTPEPSPVKAFAAGDTVYLSGTGELLRDPFVATIWKAEIVSFVDDTQFAWIRLAGEDPTDCLADATAFHRTRADALAALSLAMNPMGGRSAAYTRLRLKLYNAIGQAAVAARRAVEPADDHC
jgi:hypothetical protein